MNPQFPIYIPSRGRADTRLTMKQFDFLRVPYSVIVEADEFAQYAKVISKKKLLVLDDAFKRDYDTFDTLGTTKSFGPGPARNFAMHHARLLGASWHWVIDDNVETFWRMNRNTRMPVADGTIFRAMENFCLRYKNIALAGPDYFWQGTAPRAKHPPFQLNTRVYSCILLRADLGFQWRGRYNEDTDICLRALKAGWCTVLFKAFIQRKMITQTIAGGNTAEFYEREGTLPKSRMLVNMHADVAKLAWRFKRWHHIVDYRGFKKNKLIRAESAPTIPAGIDNLGMELIRTDRSPHGKRKLLKEVHA